MLQVFDSDAVPIALALAGTFVCIGAGFRDLRAGASERVVFAWWLLAIGALGIATGHLWNLGGGVAESGRDVFRFEGIYGSRRPFQAALVVILLAGGLLLSPFVLRRVRTNLGDRFILPFVVLGGVAAFLVVRTISLHAIDAVLYGKHILGGHPGSLLESAGLITFAVVALVAASAGTRARRVETATSTTTERPTTTAGS